jgi:Vitamin B12 dependent methionine synthase, activation domain
MMCNTFQFEFMQLGITAIQVQNDMGYREEAPDASVLDLIADVLKDCESLIDIKAEYRIFGNIEFDNEQKSVRIEGVDFKINKTVFSQLRKSKSIAVFLSTAGEETAIRGREATAEGDLLRGFVYDVIGSEIVEAAAELMQNELDNRVAPQGLLTTNRFNPGYCGWNVTEQHKLFRLMADNYCGIRLTESALMDPVKSGSGFIGIGKSVKRVPFTCSFCEMKDCFYRKVK